MRKNKAAATATRGEARLVWAVTEAGAACNGLKIKLATQHTAS